MAVKKSTTKKAALKIPKGRGGKVNPALKIGKQPLAAKNKAVNFKGRVKISKKAAELKKATPVEELETAVSAGQKITTPAKAVLPAGQLGGGEKYYESIGRRKRAIARVRVYTKKSTDIQASENSALITINGKPYSEYFKAPELQNIVEAPLKKLKSVNRFKATVRLFGGGAHGQADAVKFGLSRALVLFDANFSKKLRKAGYLTRDSREKERRKYGLKKARKAPQWAKR